MIEWSFAAMANPLPRPLRGIIPPLVTPLTGPSTADLDGLERLLEMMIGAGVNGVFPLGTTGEAPHLGREFRAGFLKDVTRIVAGRVPVLAGITDTSVDEAAWMACRAADAGCDAVVFTPPYYYPMSQEELAGFAKALAAKLPLPFFIYNIPYCTREWFGLEAVKRIAELPGCLGIKDSTWDMEFFQKLVDTFAGRKDFTILMGPEEKLWDAIMMGGHGAVTGGANLAPEFFTGIYAAAMAGDEAAAAPLRARAEIIRTKIYGALPEKSGYFRGLKCAMKMRGICSDRVAEPFGPVPEEARERIRAALEEAELI
jgi:4-hydroxy-tetrahydrodipicolinate synthase